MHIRPEDEINTSRIKVLTIYCEVITSNVIRILEQNKKFIHNKVFEGGLYKGEIKLNFESVSDIDLSKSHDRFDLLFTSPPYGDNATTIPYGQFSFLALNWIPLSDIDESIPLDANKNTRAIDVASLGGTLKDSQIKAEQLSHESSSFKKFYRELDKSEPSCQKRLSSFCYDLRGCVKSLSGLMNKDGYMVWTLGNRSLSGKRVPLDSIVWDFLEEHNMRRVAQFNRTIPTKRMPSRNNNSDTMTSEIVLIAST